ncbi:kip1 ubiquitination-promoting complex subunit 2 isoform X2 [Tachypleus tridentatus]
MMALSHFYHPVDSVKSVEQYKLVLISNHRPLPDESTVFNEQIQENDELLLLKRRITSQHTRKQLDEQELRAPTLLEIQQATQNLPSNNFDHDVEKPVILDFHTELKKILVTMVDISEKILRYHPHVQDILQAIPEPIPQTVRAPVDPVAMRQLTDMGFPEDKVAIALRINKMSPVEAMDWLLAHQSASSSQIGDTITQIPEDITDSEPLPSTSTGSLLTLDPFTEHFPSGSGLTPSAEQPSTSSSLGPPTACFSRVVVIMEKFKAYKRKHFRPNKKALQGLKEMGFAEAEIVDALRLCGNKEEKACEWLLGDRRYEASAELTVGLNPGSSIYNAIVNDPIVMLGLGTPKTFVALLHMLDSPDTSGRWLSDSSTAPILSQIFKIYHTHKHMLQLNRPLFS